MLATLCSKSPEPHFLSTLLEYIISSHLISRAARKEYIYYTYTY